MKPATKEKSTHQAPFEMVLRKRFSSNMSLVKPPCGKVVLLLHIFSFLKMRDCSLQESTNTGNPSSLPCKQTSWTTLDLILNPGSWVREESLGNSFSTWKPGQWITLCSVFPETLPDDDGGLMVKFTNGYCLLLKQFVREDNIISLAILQTLVHHTRRRAAQSLLPVRQYNRQIEN